MQFLAKARLIYGKFWEGEQALIQEGCNKDDQH